MFAHIHSLLTPWLTRSLMVLVVECKVSVVTLSATFIYRVGLATPISQGHCHRARVAPGRVPPPSAVRSSSQQFSFLAHCLFLSLYTSFSLFISFSPSSLSCCNDWLLWFIFWGTQFSFQLDDPPVWLKFLWFPSALGSTMKLLTCPFFAVNLSVVMIMTLVGLSFSSLCLSLPSHHVIAMFI